MILLKPNLITFFLNLVFLNFCFFVLYYSSLTGSLVYMLLVHHVLIIMVLKFTKDLESVDTLELLMRDDIMSRGQETEENKMQKESGLKFLEVTDTWSSLNVKIISS